MAKKKPSKASRSPAEEVALPPVGPLPLVKSRLQRIPLSGETWEVDFRQPSGMMAGPDADAPWILIVGSATTTLVRGYEVTADRPHADKVWDSIATAMQGPLAGAAGRPSRLLVGNDPLWESLRPHFAEIGVAVDSGAKLGLLDVIYEDMLRGLTGAMESDATPILEVPGMTVEKAGSFFEASAFFYKEKPWKRLREENAIEIVCPRLEGGPWYAVIMGAAGVTSGLALYGDLHWLERVWTEELSPEEQAEETEATALTYGPRDTILPEDLAAMKEHGWKAGGRDGYPEVYRKERGRAMHTPTGDEFAVLDACLRAIPPFVKKRPSDDDTPEQITVASPSGMLTLTLRWMTDPRP